MNQPIIYELVATTIPINHLENSILDPINPIFRPF
jgi:hypothetical protein